MIRAVLVAALALAAAPAFAQDGQYSLDGSMMRVPAPAGYCASGKAIDAYLAQQRQINPANMPDVVMVPCGAERFSFDFFAVRVVREGPKMTKKALLDDLRRTLPEAQALPSLVTPSETAALNKRLSDVMATGVTMNAGIRPVGLDETCGYVAGVIHVEAAAAGKAADIAIVGCVTVIRGRVTYIFRYRPGTDKDKAVAAIPELKTLAVATGAGK